MATDKKPLIHTQHTRTDMLRPTLSKLLILMSCVMRPELPEGTLVPDGGSICIWNTCSSWDISMRVTCKSHARHMHVTCRSHVYLWDCCLKQKV